jgi:hypothetical protein
MPRVTLHELAFARSGDKGDVCNIGVMAKSRRVYELLARELTVERVRAHFGAMVHGAIERYPLDNLDSLNFVLRGALGGGATKTLRFDQTGKAMCTAMLRLELEAPAELVDEARRVTASLEGSP